MNKIHLKYFYCCAFKYLKRLCGNWWEYYCEGVAAYFPNTSQKVKGEIKRTEVRGS